MSGTWTQTSTSVWRSGSLEDIEAEIAEREKSWSSVRQIALTLDPGLVPTYTGFIVYEWES